MPKTKKDPDWLKTLRDFVSVLQNIQNQRDKSDRLLTRLEQEMTTEASVYSELSPERQVMLKVGLAIVPMESPENIIQMAKRLTAAEQQSTPQRSVQRTAAKPETATA